jgi:hypothetical protein
MPKTKPPITAPMSVKVASEAPAVGPRPRSFAMALSMKPRIRKSNPSIA